MTQATASEVQKLLVSGKKQEALVCAQEGQLWGPAIILASQLGEQVISLFLLLVLEIASDVEIYYVDNFLGCLAVFS